MKNRFLPVFLLLAGVTFAVLWMQERQKAHAALGQARTVLEEHKILQGERDGLRKANENLRNQLDSLRQMPLTVQVSPTASPAATEHAADMVMLEGAPVDAAESASSQGAPAPRPTRTPEEEAAREQMRQEWAQRRQEFQTRMINSAQDRKAFLSQVPTEGLSPEYLNSHNRLLEAMTEVEALIAQGSNQELPREERTALRMKTAELAGEIQQLMQTEREILLSDYASSLGLQASETEEFVKGMQTITEMTTPPRMFGGGMRRDASGPGFGSSSSSGTNSTGGAGRP